MKIDRSRALRRVVLPVFARVNLGDIVIRHHWTGERIVLHSFRHRSYWYRGRERERDEMELLGRLVKPTDVVIEVGGHIGYISLWLAHLAAKGECHVFEPSGENREYLCMNVAGCPNVRVIPMGLGDEAGSFELFLDELTGQNSSFLADFSGYRRSQSTAFTPKQQRRAELVPVTTLDAYVADNGLEPTILKIDVEGFEARVIAGAVEALERYRPIVMAEVHDYCAESVWEVMKGLRYVVLKADGTRVTAPGAARGNLFYVPSERSAGL